MSICALGYIGIRSGRLDDWSQFAVNLLGMQQVDRGGNVRAWRMDDRKQRLIVTDDGEEGLDFMGWEVDTPENLDRIASRLENNGIAVTWHLRARADERHVSQLLSCYDPDGNYIELFCGPHIASDPFVPGRPITGFRTGTLGMGHVVLHTLTADKLLWFYRDLLGFAVSDYGMKPYPLYFFHVNSRHHSFAIVGSGRRGLHHFMVELQALDDVGQGYDIAKYKQDCVAYSLGRHANDPIISFYSNSPSGFFVEYGWGSPVIDPATWEPHETVDGPSLWGHDRVHLPEDDPGRQRLREMALDTGRRGRQAPNPDPNCAWLDSVIHRQ